MTGTVQDATLNLDDTPINTLGEWCQYIRQERGWNDGIYLCGALVGDLVRAVEA